MSDVAREILRSFVEESERIQLVAEALSLSAVPGGATEVVLPAPSLHGRVDAENLVADPQGLGSLAAWSPSRENPSYPGTLYTSEDVPTDVHTRSVWAKPKGLHPSNPVLKMGAKCAPAPVTGPYYYYSFVKIPHFGTGVGKWIEVRSDAGNTFAGGARLLQGAADDWRLIGGGPVTLTAGVSHWVEAFVNGPVGFDFTVGMCCPTLVSAIDPGGPFHGAMPPQDQYVFSWSGPSNNSNSRRHTRILDILALHEEAGGFPVAPKGATDLGRVNYLLARRQARRKPWGSKLIDLVVGVIRAEDPSFSSDGVRVVETIPNYEYRIEIAYAQTGPLAARIVSLIDDIVPAHLARTSITWGQFQADISEAGDPV